MKCEGPESFSVQSVAMNKNTIKAASRLRKNKNLDHKPISIYNT